MLLEKIQTFGPVSTDNYRYDQMARAIDYLYQHFQEQPALEEVAAQVNLSVFHFQRQFTEWAGISPKRFLQFLTTDYLKQHLTGFDNLLDAADAAGLSSQSRVYDLFVHLEAVTPQEYREKGSGLHVEYGFHATPFGECILGATERGICHLSFVQEGNRTLAVEGLQKEWERAALRENSLTTEGLSQAIFYRQQGIRTSTQAVPERLNVLVKGTNFQVKVWEALLKVPYGSVATYQSVAQHIGQPKALQAVGAACGANHIAYLIPCHRIIRKNLELREYRWGPERKKAILGWELSRGEE